MPRARAVGFELRVILRFDVREDRREVRVQPGLFFGAGLETRSARATQQERAADRGPAR